MGVSQTRELLLGRELKGQRKPTIFGGVSIFSKWKTQVFGGFPNILRHTQMETQRRQLPVDSLWAGRFWTNSRSSSREIRIISGYQLFFLSFISGDPSQPQN